MQAFVKHVRSQGKLMISGEYAVLHGAIAFAIPSKFGQDTYAYFDHKASTLLQWEALDESKKAWFSGTYCKKSLQWLGFTNHSVARTLEAVFNHLRTKTDLWDKLLRVKTLLDFPRDWGLGTSSTLIHALSSIFELNPYEVNASVFHGSGYDIACAGANSAGLYQALPTPCWTPCIWKPSFKNQLLLVYLGKKQSSKQEIRKAKGLRHFKQLEIDEISSISKRLAQNTTNLDAFMNDLKLHESILAKYLNKTSVQKELFSDFPGVTKSLGAWGGDFILAANEGNTIADYFIQKGFPTVLTFDQMFLS